MKRITQVKKINYQIKELLKKRPEIREALRVFDISYDQYQKTLEGGYHFYTDISTVPRGFNMHRKYS